MRKRKAPHSWQFRYPIMQDCELERLQYGELYKRNYYKEVKEKNRIHYELYSLDVTQEVPEDYKEISLVCVRKDGMYLGTDALSNMCSSIAKHVDGLEHFHFH